MSDYLNSLSLPGDLKDMSYDELELLTYEIRDFLVDKVSRKMCIRDSKRSVRKKGRKSGQCHL